MPAKVPPRYAGRTVRPMWRAHATQLRALEPSGHTRVVFQGSLTQILRWLPHHPNVKRGRLWIEDIAEPARALYQRRSAAMKKLAACVLALVLLVSAPAWAEDKTFTATGSGVAIVAETGWTVSYTVSGTFVGTVVLQQFVGPFPNGTWQTVLSATAASSGSFQAEPTGNNAQARYRWTCSAYTSGSIVTSVVVTATSVAGPVLGPSAPPNGSIALFSGTTGTLLKALAFPGGGTTFLRDDGTFASAGGGGGGTPANPDTSVQFNNSGSFGGSANFTYDSAGDELKIGQGRTTSPGLAVITIDGDKGAGDASQGLVVVFSDNVDQDYPSAILARIIGTSNDGENLGDVVGVYSNPQWGNAAPMNSGTLDNLVAVDVAVTALTSGITNSIGVRVANITGATNNYALYTGTGLAHFGDDVQLATTAAIVGLGEVDITSASGVSGGAGSHLILTAGDGDGMGAGGNVELLAGGSGSGTTGDIILQATDWISLFGPVRFGTNGSIATGQTAANNLVLRAYDVDGAAYKTFLTLTSNNTPDLTIAPVAGTTIVIQATTFKSSDGSSGITGATCSAWKNGLCTAS